MPYIIRCRRCNKHFFCTSFREGMREFTEHWNKRHWRWDIAPDDYPYVYRGKSPVKRKAIWGKRKKERLPDSEYEVVRVSNERWAMLEPAIGTAEFNRSLYKS